MSKLRRRAVAVAALALGSAGVAGGKQPEHRAAPEDGHLYTSTIVWKRVAGSS